MKIFVKKLSFVLIIFGRNESKCIEGGRELLDERDLM